METKNNFLIPSHRKLTEPEVESVLKKYNIETTSKLPKIKLKDPVLVEMEDINLGDVIEITRNSFAGESKYYRKVIE